MEEKIKLLISQLGENRVKRNIDLTEQLETKLGGKAAAFYISTNIRELIKAVELCKELEIDYLIIGSGSKIVLSDDRFEGLVIKNRSDNLRIFGIKGKVSRNGLGIEEALLEAESGASLKRISDYALSQGLGGLESLSLIPGTIGGNFYINPVLQEKTKQVKVLNIACSQEIKQPKEVLKDDVILSAIFQLKSKKFKM